MVGGLFWGDDFFNRGTRNAQGHSLTVHRGTHGHTHGTQGYTGVHRDTQGSIGVHWGTVHRDTQGYTGVHRGTQGYTGVHRGTQHMSYTYTVVRTLLYQRFCSIPTLLCSEAHRQSLVYDKRSSGAAVK
jgi:hypothetical protein